MLTLPVGTKNGIDILPRWPARQVLIDERAWEKLEAVQASLPEHMRLILTRGFEPRASDLGKARRLFRLAGISLFALLYKHRKIEILDIFGSNGHDQDGNHIDVSLRIQGRRVRLLPLSVFTPSSWQKKRMKKYQLELELVQASLVAHGFQLHQNATERLQIHCDFVHPASEAVL
jgi:hypothetical protein